MARKNRRVIRPAPEGVDPNPINKVLDGETENDRVETWGDEIGSNEQMLLENRPPHWAEKD